MKTFLMALLLISGPVFASDDDGEKKVDYVAEACKRAKADLIDCAYTCAHCKGADLKESCEEDIRTFIEEFTDNACYASYTVGYISFDRTLSEAIQDLVDKGRKRDEDERKRNEAKNRRAEEARKKADQLFDSVKIN